MEDFKSLIETYFPAACSLVVAGPFVNLQHKGSKQSAKLPSW